MNEAQTLAEQHDKKVLVYAEASWCSYCKKMNSDVFPQKSVRDSLTSYFYPVKIDIESEEPMVFNGKNMTERQFARSNRVQGTPTTFFVDKRGKILGTQPGFIPADTFSRLLSFVGCGVFRKMNFNEYVQKSVGIEN